MTHRLAFCLSLMLVVVLTPLAFAAPPLDLDFETDTPGQPPASATAVRAGEGYRVMVTSADTSPAHPFSTGQHSLLLENLVAEQYATARFEAAQPLTEGMLRIEFLLPYDEQVTSSELQINLIGDDGPATTLRLRTGSRFQVIEPAGAININVGPAINRTNVLVVQFDTKTNTFTGTLNGTPLSAGERTAFFFNRPQTHLTAITLRPGSSATTSARAFINRIQLGTADALQAITLPQDVLDSPAIAFDFQDETPGGLPRSASRIVHGQGYPAYIVSHDTNPRDPFDTPGNQSLMLANLVDDNASAAVFHGWRPVERGRLIIEFFLEQRIPRDDDDISVNRPDLQINILGEDDKSAILIRPRPHRIDILEGEHNVRLNQTAHANRPNVLVIEFDTEAATFTAQLNGEPLTTDEGSRAEFAFRNAVSHITGLNLRPGPSSTNASRVYINRIELGDIKSVDPIVWPAENLLPNPSFEFTNEPREVYPIIGEYRHYHDSQWAIDTRHAYHGSQSLRMEGPRPYFWQVMNQRSLESVFSVYLKGSHEGQQVEIGIENIRFGNESGIWTLGQQIQTVTLDTDWHRFALSSIITDEEIEQTLAYPLFMGHDLFRAWVRPLSDEPLWVDAAQLERDRSEPRAFNTQRGDNHPPHNYDNIRLRSYIYGPDESTLPSKDATSSTGVIAIAVRESAGLTRTDEPVWGGVPFPRGELFHADHVRLTDHAGKEVPLQTRVLDRYHRDGSIRSLLIDFQASVDANVTRQYELHYGPATSQTNAAAPLAHDDGKAIHIDTGQLALTLRKDRFDFFDLVHASGQRIDTDADRFGSEVIALDGTRYASAWGAPIAMHIETNGPNRAVIYIRGEHHSQDGHASFLEYEVRIHAFKNKDQLLIEHTFENREPYQNLAIQSHGLHLPAYHTDATIPVRFGVLDHQPIETTASADNPAVLTQVRNYFGEAGNVLLLDEASVTHTFDDHRAAGWMTAGSAAIAVEDFWQLNPKMFEASPGRLSVYHWPTRHVRYVDLPFGMSNTLRLIYAPFAAEAYHAPELDFTAALHSDAGSTLATAPLLVQPDEQWMASSGVFGGQYLTRDEAAEAYPGFEQRLDDIFAPIIHDRALTDLTGMWDYGDFGTPHGWLNNETTVIRNYWWQYLRTYDPDLFRRAWIMTRHFRDVDILYAGEGARMVHHHAGGYHTSYIHHTGHYWVTGLIWHYLLTGDQRSYRIAKESGANLMTRYQGIRTGRNLSRPIFHLAELYELTGLYCFRHAFETLYASESPWPTAGYAGGKLLVGLYHWYQITGDEQLRQRIIEHAHAMLANQPDRTVPGGRGLVYFPAMAIAAQLTDDPRFIEHSFDHLIWHLTSLHGIDHNAIRATTYLHTAREMGISAPPLMPEYAFDLALVTGRSAGPIHMQLPNPEGQPINLKLYYTRNFRIERRDIDNEHGDAIAYTITRPDGSVLAADTITGKNYNAVTFTDAGHVGTYDIELDFQNDAMGEISANTPRLKLNAERSFMTRRDRVSSAVFQYVFLAPADRDTIEVEFIDWPDRAGLYAGAVVAARIADLDGNTITTKRWGVPIGTTFTNVGQPMPTTIDRMTLSIPPSYRGQRLTLTMYPLKWQHWQIQGLDDPWLGRHPEALDPQ